MSIRCLLLPGIALAVGCTGNDKGEVLETYARIAHASYEDSLEGAVEIQASVEALVNDPSPTTHQAAKDVWLAAREPYGQTEVFRFYGGPIDNDDTGPEGLINSWPLDEYYIDYVVGDLDAGIINDPDTYPVLTLDLLTDLNQPPEVGEEAVATGYHAVEFLLWGQDLSEEGPGERPYTDYLLEGASASNSDRRGQYLELVAAMLASDVASVEEAWRPGEDNFRSGFVTQDDAEGLLDILTGMGSLSGAELAGERMQVAYDTREQEDEHSCFSDNTHRDIVNNAQGIENVYLGRYERTDGSVVEGPSLSSLVAEQDPELDARMRSDLAASVLAAEQIVVFDRDIQGSNPTGRARIEDTIDALRQQTSSIVEVATLLGLTLNLEE